MVCHFVYSIPSMRLGIGGRVIYKLARCLLEIGVPVPLSKPY